MDFELSFEHESFRASLRDYVAQRLDPIADECDREHRFPTEIFRELGDLGYLGSAIPEEYGGGGMDLFGYLMLVEELARVSPAFAMDVMVHSGAISYGGIFRQGTEAQRSEFLPRLCSGEAIGAVLQTEPNAGSDVSSMVTRATKVDDGYKLNGNKLFITNFGAPLDSIGCILARDDSAGGRGMTEFIVEKSAPGISIAEMGEKLGMRASPLSEVIFEDTPVPAKNILGEVGRGMRAALQIIDFDRLGCIALAVGSAQGALDLALKYARERQAFGGPISRFQGVQMRLADMAADIEHGRLAAYHVAWKAMRGERFTREAAMGKLHAARAATHATNAAMEVHGGYGYMAEYRVERLMRDVKAIELGGGINDILQMVIARSLLGPEARAGVPA